MKLYTMQRGSCHGCQTVLIVRLMSGWLYDCRAQNHMFVCSCYTDQCRGLAAWTLKQR